MSDPNNPTNPLQGSVPGGQPEYQPGQPSYQPVSQVDSAGRQYYRATPQTDFSGQPYYQPIPQTDSSGQSYYQPLDTVPQAVPVDSMGMGQASAGGVATAKRLSPQRRGLLIAIAALGALSLVLGTFILIPKLSGGQDAPGVLPGLPGIGAAPAKYQRLKYAELAPEYENGVVEAWRFSLEHTYPAEMHPYLSQDGKTVAVVWQGDNGTILGAAGFDMKTGKQKWKQNIAGMNAEVSIAAMDQRGTCLSYPAQNNIICDGIRIDILTGKVAEWEENRWVGKLWHPVAATEKYIFFNEGDTLIATDIDTNPLWSLPVGQSTTGRGVLCKFGEEVTICPTVSNETSTGDETQILDTATGEVRSSGVEGFPEDIDEKNREIYVCSETCKVYDYDGNYKRNTKSNYEKSLEEKFGSRGIFKYETDSGSEKVVIGGNKVVRAFLDDYQSPTLVISASNQEPWTLTSPKKHAEWQISGGYLFREYSDKISEDIYGDNYEPQPMTHCFVFFAPVTKDFKSGETTWATGAKGHLVMRSGVSTSNAGATLLAAGKGSVAETHVTSEAESVSSKNILGGSTGNATARCPEGMVALAYFEGENFSDLYCGYWRKTDNKWVPDPKFQLRTVDGRTYCTEPRDGAELLEDLAYDSELRQYQARFGDQEHWLSPDNGTAGIVEADGTQQKQLRVHYVCMNCKDANGKGVKREDLVDPKRDANQDNKDVYGVELPKETDADQVRYLSEIIEKSKAGRAALQPATRDVVACTNLPTAVQTIENVLENRRTLASAVQAARADKIPNGSELVNQLLMSLHLSRLADEQYLEWAKSVRDHGCGAGVEYGLSGDDYSLQVNGWKETFSNNWNTNVAPRYGVPTVTRQQL